MSQSKFETVLADHQWSSLKRTQLTTLQLNIGKLCNQACHHCHVEAGPKRTEMMDLRTTNRILSLLGESSNIHTVDITGGAPEMMPHFRRLVSQAKRMGKEVIDRCNLSVLFEKGQEDTAEFLRDHGVQVVASLPCYSKENVEKQRGRGVFDRSIRALNLLNDLGYGKKDSFLKLHLVYNPLGAFLPPDQSVLELAYKKELKELFDIEFSSLFTITNMPIKRFLENLRRQGKEEEYLQELINNFNPDSVSSLMCRNLVSVGWDGAIFDCDFNQMLDVPLDNQALNIWDIESFNDLVNRPIALADHCFGCTAGAGSSCGGSLVEGKGEVNV